MTTDNSGSPHDSSFGVAPGGAANIFLEAGEGYSGATVTIPLHVRRGRKKGPTLFVTGAVHGNEINGTGAIRALVRDDFELERGTLLLVPVINIFGFERHSRYLPDRRDLNRCFPGSATGSLASRLAHVVFEKIIKVSDFGLDLHTAAVRRTNYPNVRADTTKPEIRKLAKSFGSDIILSSKGPKGSLRREATAAGCPTIILEAGEVLKVEPAIVEHALRGVRNTLIALDMLAGEPEAAESTVIKSTRWVRADMGGFLNFHVAPGDVVDKGEPLASNTDLLGEEKNQLVAPFRGIVLGMTTLPAIRPGEPVCHLGRLPRKSRTAAPSEANEKLRERVRDDLAASVRVVEPEES